MEKSLAKYNEIIFIIIASIIAGFIVKIPAIFSVDGDFFYPRNIGFIVFPVLSAYFAWKNRLSWVKIAYVATFFIAGAAFINTLPNVENDTLILSCIHLILLMWAVLGFTFAGEIAYNSVKRMGFLKYTGDLAVMMALIVIAGGILSAITINLFRLIGYTIEEFYSQNIAIYGLTSVPIVATYLVRSNPQLVGKISPLIARIFSPLVLVMLLIFLPAIAFSGKDPYNDREFLLIFNALLVGVMALIFFSASDSGKEGAGRFQRWILFLLSVITVVVNGVALSAILFRISEWGITPNRMAVLGANLLIFINLILILVKLFMVIRRKSELDVVGETISRYLPVYVIWTVIVTFLFPFIFG